MRLASASAVRNPHITKCYHAARMAPHNEMSTPTDHRHSIRPWLRTVPGICIANPNSNACFKETCHHCQAGKAQLIMACMQTVQSVLCRCLCSVSCPGACYLQMTASIKRNPALADLLAMTAWQHSCTSTITRVRLSLPHPQLSIITISPTSTHPEKHHQLLRR